MLPVVVGLGVGCGSSDDSTAPAPTGAGAAASAPASAATSTSTTAAADPSAVTVVLRVEDRTGTEPGFAAEVRATLTDPRGWQQADFAFTFDAPAAPYLVVLAEPEAVDALCAPYDTGGRYSCQLGPVVALNADRWRTATPEWTGDLATYRQMLVNHEVGHLLGQHHPHPQCPEPGEPAAVMAQQSTELDGCLPNPWPLAGEIACAARHVELLAPPYEPDAEATCRAQR